MPLGAQRIGFLYSHWNCLSAAGPKFALLLCGQPCWEKQPSFLILLMKEQKWTWTPFEVSQIVGLVIETSEHRGVLFPFTGHVFSAKTASEQSTEVFLNFPATGRLPSASRKRWLSTCKPWSHMGFWSASKGSTERSWQKQVHCVCKLFSSVCRQKSNQHTKIGNQSMSRVCL